jgi:hypothetical protein
VDSPGLGLATSRPTLQDYIDLRDNELEDFLALAPHIERGTLAARPAVAEIGSVYYETDSDILDCFTNAGWVHLKYMGAWTSNPLGIVVTQGAAVSNTVLQNLYKFEGGEATWNFHVSCTSAGTAASPVLVTLPLAIVGPTTATCVDGHVLIFDSSPATRYNVLPEVNSSTTIAFGYSSGTASTFGTSPAITLASGDQIRGWVRWRYR